LPALSCAFMSMVYCRPSVSFRLPLRTREGPAQKCRLHFLPAALRPAVTHAQRDRQAVRLPEGLDDRAAVQRAHLALRAPRYDRVEVRPGLSWIGGTGQPPVLDRASRR